MFALSFLVSQVNEYGDEDPDSQEEEARDVDVENFLFKFGNDGRISGCGDLFVDTFIGDGIPDTGEATGEHEDEDSRGDVFDDKFEDVGYPDIGATGDFFPAFIYAEDPGEEDNFKHSKDDQRNCTGPVVIFIESTILEEEYGGEAEYEDDGSEGPGGGAAFPAELIAKEPHDGRTHGQGAGYTGKEEETEPEYAGHDREDGPPLLEEVRHGAEAEAEATGLLDEIFHAFYTEIAYGDGYNDGSTEDDLYEFVHPAGAHGIEGNVIAFAQVGGIALNAAHADGEGEENLTGGGEPYFRRPDGRKIGRPEVVEAFGAIEDGAIAAGLEGDTADGQEDAEYD